jgi:Saccharopine dehydrogenase NADP binding domain
MTTGRPIVAVLGATGHTGRLILDGGHPDFAFRLIGRDATTLSALAAATGEGAEWRRIDAIESVAVTEAVAGSAIVINVAGSFNATAAAVAQASMRAGAAYIDISNERPSVQAVLDLSDLAERAAVHLAPASGYGTVATEGLTAWLARGEAMRRVDLALLPENEGRSTGAFESVLLGLASGGARVTGGRYQRVLLGRGARRLTLPDGSRVTLIPADLGDLASIPAGYGAREVTASVGLGIPLLAARSVLPAVSLAMRSSALRSRLTARGSRGPQGAPHPDSYLSRAWARVRLEDGRTREGWMSAGEGYRFTANSVLEVARRIADGRAQPGARTAIREFGPDLLAALPGVRLELVEETAAGARAG